MAYISLVDGIAPGEAVRQVSAEDGAAVLGCDAHGRLLGIELFSAGAPVAPGAAGRRPGWDPRQEKSPYLYLRAAPQTVRAWRGTPELRGRVVMRDGAWVAGTS